jgi:hypothetical protein
MKRLIISLLSALVLTLVMFIGLENVPGATRPVLAAPPAGSNHSTLALASTAETTTTIWLPVVMGSGGSSDSDVTYITFNGDSIAVDGSGTTVSGSVITVTAAGTYSLTGTLNDGQLVVNTEDEAAVNLVLNNVDMTNSTSAPLFVSSAAQTVITLTTGTQNTLTDGADYVFADGEDEPDGALFSQDDLVIQGDGTLTVNGNYKNGIVSQDNLKITGGNITVTAAKHGLKGKDSITILVGTFTITAGGDGMQSDNDEDTALGYITIADGSFNINSANDGLQAETTLSISGGDFTIVAGGGSSVVTDDSAKGLKAEVEITVTGGTFNINSADDALNTSNNLIIDGGAFTLATADDGIHSDATVTINGGNISITQCYEGIEGTYVIINNGQIDLIASDDGINVAGGNDDPASGSGYYLEINGGYIVVDANGDGLDANGSIYMTDGVVLVNGPTRNDNGAIDYDATFNMTGGFLVGAGSAGMAQAPSASSTQYAVLVRLPSTKSAGTLFHLQTQAGSNVLTFAPSKNYQSLVFSSPNLAKGTTYLVYTGGSSTGTVTDGLYTGGTYTPGTKVSTFTISNIITTL